MTTHEFESICGLTDSEINAVCGGQIVMGPIFPEPPITRIIPLSGGTPILTTPPHVGPFPVH